MWKVSWDERDYIEIAQRTAESHRDEAKKGKCMCGAVGVFASKED